MWRTAGALHELLLLCCESVCVVDPVCCDFEWDENCVALASQSNLCRCPWDCQAAPGGVVDVPELIALLAVWNIPGVNICDFNADGTANVPDLLELLANWGPCP